MKNAFNIFSRNNSPYSTLLFLFITIVSISTCIAQQHQIKPDLSSIKKFHVVNRKVTVIKNSTNKNPVVHMDARENAGIVWINDLLFENGIIEFDVKGENIPQQSFVGMAFHAVNDSTYDAIYLRPFNFGSKDAIKNHHSIQYISLPKYDWPFLREKHPGIYENTLFKLADPDKWLHIKISITKSKILVYVNNDSHASLSVKPLSTIKSGKIGFWTGNGSKGDFSNLKVIKTK